MKSADSTNCPRKLIIHAPNIHMGGGLVLLTGLLESLNEFDVPVIVIADERANTEVLLPDHVVIRKFKPSFWGRFLAERYLKKIVNLTDTILCFGNLPPLYNLPAKVTLFLQNDLLLDWQSLRSFPLKTRIRINVERIYLRMFAAHVQEIAVQTLHMRRRLEKILPGKKILAMPFLYEKITYMRIMPERKVGLVEYDFIYVASGDAHKNHRNLIEAWKLLAQEGLYPSLCLTIDAGRSAELCDWLGKIKSEMRLNIINLGVLSNRQVLETYRHSKALIFPSFSESFGLPLIEARQAGLAILAPEADYVRDIIDPEETFDPRSAISISRAVQRYLGYEQRSLDILSGTDFIKNIL